MLKTRIAVIGLGYVGLPLAIALAKKHAEVFGFDIDETRVKELRAGVDQTNEISRKELAETTLNFTYNPTCLRDADFIIVTVPTPTDKSNRPNLIPLKSACRTIGEHITKGTIVIFESTVFPTATESICGPIIEEVSGLTCGKDFKLSFSPERINPGDKKNTLTKICKIVSGQDAETLEKVAALYESIIEKGVHRASSIAVAEFAKIIENTQRDLNIALMNEIAMICDRLGINTMEVIDAASTKWNFLRFTPGLVGGHCIGVDPYYLIAKADELGYYPAVIEAGRRINNQMAEYVTLKALKLLAMADLPIRNGRFGILGLTFKENVPDFRNSKVMDIIRYLNEYGIRPMVHDPYLEALGKKSDIDFEPVSLEQMQNMHCLFYTVPHDQYKSLTPDDMKGMLVNNGVLIDVKSVFEPSSFSKGVQYWAL